MAIILSVMERPASHTRTLPGMRMRDGFLIGLWPWLALVPGSLRLRWMEVDVRPINKCLPWPRLKGANAVPVVPKAV